MLLKAAVGVTTAADTKGLPHSYSRNKVDFVIVIVFAVVTGADLLDGVFELAQEDATPWPFMSFLAGEEVVTVS